jgi:LPS-assembly protein
VLRFSFILICWSGLLLATAAPVRSQELAGCHLVKSLSAQKDVTKNESGADQTHSTLTGSETAPVQIDCENMQFFADHMEIYHDKNRVIGVGHVLFKSGDSQIYAERVEFDTKTRTGTFYDAAGSAFLGNRVDRSFFGTQEPDAYFWGAEIEKVGPKKYRIARGGFTTCVQPTPRWEVAAGSATITLEDHAVLKNSLLKVKGVPLMYLPVFYYPIQSDDRATGFLLPIYGNSNLHGQSLSNAFFWAISRSQDLTLEHDWFTRTGQGYGGEYRVLRSAQSDGNARLYFVREHAATWVNNGRTVESPARRSYEIRGNARTVLPGHTRVAAYADYFSDITVQQLYSQNIYDASLRTRRFGVSSSDNWKRLNLSGSVSRDEYFYGEEQSIVSGSRPRISLSHSVTRVGKTPIYLSGGVDYNNAQRDYLSGTNDQRLSLQRMDSSGGVRVPFTKWPFLTLNSNLTWHGTWYDKSLNATGATVPVPIFRPYLDMRAEIVGPVFVRVWDRPRSQRVARIKHVIEPTVEFRRVTLVENYDRIIKLEGSDYTIGGSLQTTYGVTNRLLVKPGGEDAVSRDFLTVSVQQTHYGNPKLSQFDPAYSTSFRGRAASAYSPVSIVATVTPAIGSSGNVRLEYDPILGGFQSISAGGSVNRGAALQVTGSYSRVRYESGGLALRSDNYINAGTTFRTWGSRIGGVYTFDYDIGRSTLIQQRMTGFYNTQCCGIAAEFQTYNYPQFSRFVIPQDHRFNVSFTLAGIGTFSNFLGALTGQPTSR